MSSTATEKTSFFEKKVLFWALLGPISILLTLSLGLFNAFPGIAFLSMTAFLGVFLCFKWQFKGLLASVALLVIVSLMTLSFFEPQTRLWQMGLLLALVLGLVVCNYAFIEAASLFGFLNVKAESNQSKIDELKQKFAQMQAEWEEDRNALFEKLLDRQNEAMKLRTKIRSLDREIEVYQEKISALKEQHQLKIDQLSVNNEGQISFKKSLNELTAQKDSLLEEIQTLKADNNSLQTTVVTLENDNSLLSQSLYSVNEEIHDLHEAFIASQEEIGCLKTELFEINQQTKNCVKTADILPNNNFENQKSLLIKQFEEEKAILQISLNDITKQHSDDVKKVYLELRRYEGLYKQLKKQFEEKNSDLEMARKELFMKENTLLETHLEINHLNQEEDIYLKKAQKDIEALLNDNHRLEEENKALESLVSTLLASK